MLNEQLQLALHTVKNPGSPQLYIVWQFINYKRKIMKIRLYTSTVYIFTPDQTFLIKLLDILMDAFISVIR